MNKALVSFENLVDLPATVVSTSTSASADLSAANLKVESIGVMWRSSGQDDYIDIDFASTKTVNYVGFATPRDAFILNGADQVTVSLDNATPGAGSVAQFGPVASGVVEGEGYFSLPLGMDYLARFVRIRGVTSHPRLEIGRPWVCAAREVDRNFVYGQASRIGDLSIVERAPLSGRKFVTELGRMKRERLNFQNATVADQQFFRAGDFQIGRSGQMLLVKDPNAPATTTIFGTPQEVTDITLRAFNIHSKQYDILEDV